jgi:E3 ubiquitin-protein ligase HUWE1
MGIHPSAEANSIVPTVLKSISLNNAGMKMVVSSRAFESFLEIFESPEHVRCMENDLDLANCVGSSFDELARHHPSLRPAISNAVLDMVARIVHMAKTKAVVGGWGAKLLVTDPQGNTIVADESLLGKTGPVSASKKGKEKDRAGDFDVEMADADVEPQPDSSSNATPVDKSSSMPTPYTEITPYILALGTFLTALIANSNLKSSFVRDGGIELLLDLSVAPSLNHNFGETAASRTLHAVTSQLVESSPMLGLPSLLNRIQSAVDTLDPLVNKKGSYPFLSPFLIPDLSLATSSGEWDHAIIPKVANGTKVVKALLNAQSLIKTLYQSFPFSNRQGTVNLHPVNVFDYYTRLIKSLGPLLRNVLCEEMFSVTLVPPHWSNRKTANSQDRLNDSTSTMSMQATIIWMMPHSPTCSPVAETGNQVQTRRRLD